MDKAPKLKPCPFCGSDDVRREQGVFPDQHYISCVDCGASIDGKAATWNTRADLTPSLERLKRWEKFTRADDWITAEQFDREFQAFGLELRDLIAKMEAGE